MVLLALLALVTAATSAAAEADAVAAATMNADRSPVTLLGDDSVSHTSSKSRVPCAWSSRSISSHVSTKGGHRGAAAIAESDHALFRARGGGVSTNGPVG